jgi:predicted metalloprotease
MKIHDRPRTLAILAATLASVLLLAACGGGSSALAPAATAAPTRTPQVKSLESAFSFNQMDSFLKSVTPIVGEFFKNQYPSIPPPRNIIYVRSGEVGATGCGSGNGRPGRADGDSYEYCPSNDTIYVGQDLLWAFFKIGDAAPVVALAHEWGHHVQAYRGLPSPRTLAQSISYENQADCIAGAWEKYAGEKGWLEVPDDIGDANALMEAIGTREVRGRDHGTTAERSAALHTGYEAGLKGCNAYLPSSPIVA